MKKIWLLIILFIPLNVCALEVPELNSSKVLIYDLKDDTILYARKSNEPTSIASLTKILTAITALKYIPDLNETITITSSMLKQTGYNASVAGLKVNEKVTYLDLLYCLMLPSGADAAAALAISLKGDISSFVLSMNDLALEIGMTSSNFTNVTGLDASNNYSTLEDVLILLKYALENPIFKNVYTTKNYTLSNGRKVTSTLIKYNEQLNADISSIIGSKTGLTTNAGMALTTLVNKNNHEYIIITTNAPISKEVPNHLIDHLKIIDYLTREESHNILIIPETENLNQPRFNIDRKLALLIFALMGLILIIPKKRKQ